jgi:Fe2+ transport system protein FeoA
LTLDVIGPGDVVEVDRVSPACRGIERRRLMDLGIVPGTQIEFERRGLSGGVDAYRVRGTVIALRAEQAAMVSVKRVNGARL